MTEYGPESLLLSAVNASIARRREVADYTRLEYARVDLPWAAAGFARETAATKRMGLLGRLRSGGRGAGAPPPMACSPAVANDRAAGIGATSLVAVPARRA